jgi:hypothetical protein
VRRALAGCLGLAALSLLLWRQPAYDPTAWLIWGRELTEGTLGIAGGPSWKPLPVPFTFLFAYAGDDAAPLLWLLFARTAGLIAVVLAFRVAWRLGGRTAAWLAAAGLALQTDFLFNLLRGDSEGLLIALAMAALLLHLDGRHRTALAVGLVAGLVRPEVWIPLAGYALWLLHRDRRPATVALAVGGGAALLAAWFVPDYLSTGQWLHGAERAQNPVGGSPGQSAFPFGMTFVYASVMLAWPLYAGAVYVVLRERTPTVRGIAAAATALMITVAILAELGFTGNIRYAALPAALVAVLGGLGLPGLIAFARQRLTGAARIVVTAAAAIAVAVSLGIVGYGFVRLVREERIYGPRLDAAVAAAGGTAAIRACREISATPFERQALAYRLHIPIADVTTTHHGPGIALIRDHRELPGVAALPVVAQLPSWTIRRACLPPSG